MPSLESLKLTIREMLQTQAPLEQHHINIQSFTLERTLEEGE